MFERWRRSCCKSVARLATQFVRKLANTVIDYLRLAAVPSTPRMWGRVTPLAGLPRKSHRAGVQRAVGSGAIRDAAQGLANLQRTGSADGALRAMEFLAAGFVRQAAEAEQRADLRWRVSDQRLVVLDVEAPLYRVAQNRHNLSYSRQ